MTIWEFFFLVFSWSGNKTNKEDLLIKLNFHSQEESGSRVDAPISFVAQSWGRRSQPLPGNDGNDEGNQRSRGFKLGLARLGQARPG